MKMCGVNINIKLHKDGKKTEHKVGINPYCLIHLCFCYVTIPQTGQQYTELHEFRSDDGRVTGTSGENITAHIAHNQEILRKHSTSVST
jgi:hypothetical protein